MAVSEIPNSNTDPIYRNAKPLSPLARWGLRVHLMSLELRKGNESRLQHPVAIEAKKRVIEVVSAGQIEVLSFVDERKEGVACEFGVSVEGAENIPSDGPILVISNHFNGGRLCGLNQAPVMSEVIERALPSKKRGYRFVVSSEKNLQGLVKATRRTPLEPLSRMADKKCKQVSREIMTNFIAAWGCIPTGLEGTKRLLFCLGDGDVVGLFPSGVDEYQMNKVDHRAGKLVDIIGERLGDVSVLPIGYRMNLYTGNYGIRVGKPFWANDRRRGGLTTADFMGEAIARNLPPEMHGYYKN